ncbi:hypothetical protein E2C01_065291 [Portunus trituberculatus]|uniref:Uncharacterized protein n=1 Tax=Portunus trituberculatus TaxID=210409 RepID=A0A5B7HR99_PORTR|nr:hypothetical protein [Portunus trituberculatus]
MPIQAVTLNTTQTLIRINIILHYKLRNHLELNTFTPSYQHCSRMLMTTKHINRHSHAQFDPERCRCEWKAPYAASSHVVTKERPSLPYTRTEGEGQTSSAGDCLALAAKALRRALRRLVALVPP